MYEKIYMSEFVCYIFKSIMGKTCKKFKKMFRNKSKAFNMCKIGCRCYYSFR